MQSTTFRSHSRPAFTLIELLVVVAIILVIAALAAAFAPRVSENQNLSRAVDNLEQWLLTAKMRAKRDRLATGVRFIQLQNEGDTTGVFSQVQYIQQPDPISGVPNVTTLVSAANINGIETVTFSGVDFTVPGFVQAGDYLEVRDGGVYSIMSVASGTSLTLGVTGVGSTPYDLSLSITIPTSNFRILRQARILIGEEPLSLPNNFAVNFNNIPGTTTPGSNVALAPNGIYYEILFSPTGAVVGTNAGSGAIVMSVWDSTMEFPDPSRVGIVGVQSRTGFIGAYSVYSTANPFGFAESGRESGL